MGVPAPPSPQLPRRLVTLVVKAKRERAQLTLTRPNVELSADVATRRKACMHVGVGNDLPDGLDDGRGEIRDGGLFLSGWH
jgi:hypothetical protein